MRKRILTVKTWCSLDHLLKRQYIDLHRSIFLAVMAVPETEVRDGEKDMLNLFPLDSMGHGLEGKVKIEVTDIPCGMGPEDRDRLAEIISKSVARFFPEADIFCVVRATNPSDGCWAC